MIIVNNIDTYLSGEISSDTLYNKYILNNKPCVIRNFYKKTNKTAKYFLDNSKNYIENSIAYLKIGTYTKYPIDDYVSNIKNKDKVIFSNTVRSWSHDNGNRTRWHYDSNGINIFNICLSGSKRFYLNPPMSMSVYPFLNICVNDKHDNNTYVDLYESDLLFLPCFWYHCVLTTSDNTFNINYKFLLDKSVAQVSERDNYVFTLHKMFSTNMCIYTHTNPCVHYGNKSYLQSFIYGVYEVKYILLLFFLLYKLIHKTKYINHFTYFMILLSIYIYSSNTVLKWSEGMINLNAIYIGIMFLLLHCYNYKC